MSWDVKLSMLKLGESYASQAGLVIILASHVDNWVPL